MDRMHLSKLHGKLQELLPRDVDLDAVAIGARETFLVGILQRLLLHRQDSKQLRVEASAVDEEGDGVPEGVVDALFVRVAEGSDDTAGLSDLGAILGLECGKLLAELDGRRQGDGVASSEGVDRASVGILGGDIAEHADLDSDVVKVGVVHVGLEAQVGVVGHFGLLGWLFLSGFVSGSS